MSRIHHVATIALVAAVTTGCTSEKTGPAGAVVLASLPAGFFLTTAPEDARPLVEVKSSARAGDEVAFQCRIGGRSAPFTETRAVMVVIDPALPSCADNPEDTCPVPWDYCCETQETRLAHTATVQVADATGNPLTGTLKENQGLSPLAWVTVVGKVSESEAGRFVVNATGVFLHPKS